MNAIETTILLIDDDLIANFYNQKVILKTQPTAKVISFEGAKMALNYLNKLNDDGKHPSPDIILLDINMPEMDGWSFLESYTKTKFSKNSATKIFILTSENFEENKEKKARYKIVSNYICKPLDKNKLKKLLTAL